MTEFREIAQGLHFPEGPVVLADGSVLVVEIRSEQLTRIHPDGRIQQVASIPGGPNGAALGPDGAVYICNNGGFAFGEIEEFGITIPIGPAPNYRTGSIERVDLANGDVTTLYDCAGDVPLRGPNDIVFDADGGFWFTDHGKTMHRERDRVGVFYARADGSQIEEVIFQLPEVAEAAVIGAFDEAKGEHIVAVVACKPNQNLTEQQVAAHLESQLAKYKLPQEIVFRPELPKGPTGKILKRELRQQWDQWNRDHGAAKVVAHEAAGS